jgi:biopolymer transport protein ExbD
MKLQRPARDEPEINLTSLIDVVLLLIIFFMVSTTFIREAEINIRLPEASDEAVPAPVAETLEIAISQAGDFVVNGRPLVNNERRTLRRAIEQLVGDKRDMPVVIRADAESTHQAFVTAMSVAGELGFQNVAIATVTTPDA